MYRRHTYRDDIAGPVWLYRVYAGDTLAYVGVSADPKTRIAKHRRKPWGKSFDRIGLQWFPSRADGFAAERAAILAERPLYNTARPRGAML
ncbi:hypothetical protein MOKP105_04780 [Mycobacterium avium subsp. hominissuis]